MVVTDFFTVSRTGGDLVIRTSEQRTKDNLYDWYNMYNRTPWKFEEESDYSTTLRVCYHDVEPGELMLLLSKLVEDAIDRCTEYDLMVDRSIVGIMDHDDSILQKTTITGRFSVFKPRMQNLPYRKTPEKTNDD